MIRVFIYKLLGRYCPKFLSPYRKGVLFKKRISYNDLIRLEPWFFKPHKFFDEYTNSAMIDYYSQRSEMIAQHTPFYNHMVETVQIDPSEEVKTSTKWKIYGKPEDKKDDSNEDSKGDKR